MGFEHLKSLYTNDEDFGALYSSYQKHPKEDFFAQDGYLFKGTRLCIPKSGSRELLIREVHAGSLVGHFGENKTLTLLGEYYYWPGIDKDIQDVLKGCATCQIANSHLLSQGLYTSLLVLTQP